MLVFIFEVQLCYVGLVYPLSPSLILPHLVIFIQPPPPLLYHTPFTFPAFVYQ